MKGVKGVSGATCLGVLLGVLASGSVMASESGSGGDVRGVPADSDVRTEVDGNMLPPIEYATVWANEEGSQVTECRIEGLEWKSYAPPASPQWIGISPDDVESIGYAVLPPGYEGSWHYAPGPQWVVTLSGQWEVEMTDGSTLVQGPGEMQFNTGNEVNADKGRDKVGHVTRTVGDEPNVQLIVKLKEGAAPDRTDGPCAW